MPLSPGARLGPYEILAPLGAGGMGEVYKARDTRLDRTVAIKVLPAHLASSADLKQRFEREARAVSGLSHPNICTLHDIGSQSGVDFLVMEHLEGETLAARIEKGALPLDQILRIAAEVAGALDRAHRAGVVHRDLKPGNIMLTRSGAKLLDFGLAKLSAPEAAAPAAGLSSLKTEHNELTAQGTIMGTFQYMAPEQLEGREADARTDIFAFGAVLYEMATGRKAFSGKSQASLIASILAADPPPISTIQPMCPPALDRAVRRCLAKEPDDRWQSAADLDSELRWIAEGGSQAGIPAPVTARRVKRERIWIAVAVVALLAATALALVRAKQESPPGNVVRLSISSPAAELEAPFGFVRISPDGRQVVFVSQSARGDRRIWARSLDSLTAHALSGTEGAEFPFWSPDSRHVGFFADGKLKKIDVGGGPPLTLCEAPGGMGGAWSREGVILFSRNMGEGIWRVAAEGGKPEPVTRVEAKEQAHRWPAFLPDGKHFLFLGDASRTEDHFLKLGSLDSQESVRLFAGVTNVAFAPPEYLLFVRDGSLLAQRFDTAALRPTGEPRSLAEKIADTGHSHYFEFSVSETGILTYRSASQEAQLTWVDRSGRPIETLGEVGSFDYLELSPGGGSLSFGRLGPDGRTADLWFRDLVRGSTSRLTFHPGADFGAIWSPDESEVVFGSAREKEGELYRKSLANPGEERVFLKWEGSAVPSSWSPDGRFILFWNDSPKTKGDIWVVPSSGTAEAQPLIQTPFDEVGPRFSPDGRWFAYVSDESGRPEVYLQTFPSLSRRVQVSTGGGGKPRWRGDGGEIDYVTFDGRLTAVSLKRSAGGIEIGPATDLFELRGTQYAPGRDGQRFLVDLRKEDPWRAPVTVVLNWPESLRNP